MLTIAAICVSLFSFVACDKDKGPDTGAREKTAYERYIEMHPEYDGTEEEWLDAPLNGTLGKENGVTITFVTDENADAHFAQITVDEENGEAFLVCKTNLETVKFGHNNWQASTISDYFNKDIYNIIFNDPQKETLLTSTVANDAESMGFDTGFSTGPTEDKLFLLSYAELNLYESKFVAGGGTSSYCVVTLSKGGYMDALTLQVLTKQR